MSGSAVSRLLVFRLGDERFGVPLTDVDEVIELPEVRRIPDAAPSVLGVASIRGAFVMVYDPRPILRVGGRIDGAALLFMRGDRRVGLAVDDVFDAVTVVDGELRPPPASGALERFVVGVVRRGSDLIAVVDSDALLGAAMSVHPEGSERKNS